MQPFFDGVSEGLKYLCAPLPEEPVGPGASWQVTDLVKVAGTELTRTTKYVLEAVEGQ